LRQRVWYGHLVPTSDDHRSTKAAKPREFFVTTQWSMVLDPGRSDWTGAREALAQLCETYWYPLCAYVRRTA
jgi:hypothetical protein